MNGSKIREQFLKFFKERGHRIVPSSSLIPENDPSVLLTTAGMQQFKPYFTGAKDPLKDNHPTLGEPLLSKRAASVQKCVRTSDIDQVGDPDHLSFFEMLGNFSFGDYWKEEAIAYADDLLTKVYGIKGENLTAAYFAGGNGLPEDRESKEILKKNYADRFSRIEGRGREDNFWGPTGGEGPCGPTVDFYAGGVELWSLVFNEFYCSQDGAFKPGLIKGVDTGLGLERIAAFLQGKKSVYETDLLKPLLEAMAGQVGATPSSGRDRRIAADHLRASVFLLADHVRPSNKEQGYILRRLLRRLFIKLDLLAISAQLETLLRKTIELYQDVYPELGRERDIIIQFALEEDGKFDRTLAAGNKALEDLIRKSPGPLIDGEKAFEIFSSLGTPIDYMKEKARETGLKLDEAAFERALAEHQALSRAGREGKFGGHGLTADRAASEEAKQKMTRLHTATHLVHAALRKFLGEEVHQAGSDINPTRARFDFTFPRKLTEEEKTQIEDWANQQIARDLTVSQSTMPYRQAVEEGALAFFKEKYGALVDLYMIWDEKTGEIVSKELCGGPHVQKTSQIGRLRILKEESSSSGVRRIRLDVE